ncbi:MAG: DUF1343 domain-containing protein [Deltaproteobacteria bacterium]
MVVTGLARVLDDPGILSGIGRFGLLYNQASVDARFRPVPDLLAGVFAERLAALFGPQHGAAGTEQDNMIETEHSAHPRLGIPVYSLYSRTRRPTPEMLDGLDAIVVDLQDTGTRVYTYATTVLYLMEAAANTGTRVVILDRPNPINGKDVEGNLLNPQCASFVGPHPLPMRHGLTLGELMTLYNTVYALGCRLEVVTMKDWDRTGYFEATGLPWVLPSPNMPLVETAVVYPGQVILEGTNLSEGRGTTRPFEIFGAPYVEPRRVIETIEEDALKGAVLREIEFRPTFNKWAGELCRGFQIHVIDRERFRPYRFTLAMLSSVLRVHPDEFRWSSPPYEYVHDRLPADLILGETKLRTGLEDGRSVFEMEDEWMEDLEEFMAVRSRFLLYP